MTIDIIIIKSPLSTFGRSETDTVSTYAIS
jgi:hypothetical protein